MKLRDTGAPNNILPFLDGELLTMPVTGRIDKTTGVLICTVTGATSVEDLLAAGDEYIQDPDFRPGMDALWDVRGAEMTGGTLEQLRRFGSTISQRVVQRGVGYRVAIVSAGDVSFGIGRQWEAIADQLPFDIMVFRDVEEAWRWLRSSEATGS
jgi:hypothetical protein